MTTIQEGNYARLVWIKKGEEFPGTKLGGQKQGFHLLWTGSNLCDFKASEYLGPDYDRNYVNSILSRHD